MGPWSRVPAAAAAGLIGALISATVVTAAEIKILCTTALFTALEELAPQFERASGHKLVMSFANAVSMTKRIADGEAADVAIVAGAGVDELIKQGKVIPGSRVDIARSEIGVAVRAGAPKPDISSPVLTLRTGPLREERRPMSGWQGTISVPRKVLYNMLEVKLAARNLFSRVLPRKAFLYVRSLWSSLSLDLPGLVSFWFMRRRLEVRGFGGGADPGPGPR
jgi:hypothetical protein